MATEKAEGQGRAVVLPNGERRIDYIRNAYFNKAGAHTDKCQTRSQIKNAINEMLPEGQEIPYQIVFAATKTAEDPRIAAAAAAKVRAEAKAAKEKAAAEEAKAAKAAKAAA